MSWHVAAQQQRNEIGVVTANLPKVPWGCGHSSCQPPATHRKQEITEPCVLHLPVLWLTRSRRKRVWWAPVSAWHTHLSSSWTHQCAFRSCDLPYILSTHCKFIITAWTPLPTPLHMRVSTIEHPCLGAGEILELSRKRSHDQPQELCISHNGKLTPERYL